MVDAVNMIGAFSSGDSTTMEKAYSMFVTEINERGIAGAQRKALIQLVDSVLKDEPGPTQKLTGDMFGFQTHYMLSSIQKEYFTRIKSALASAPEKECNHSNLDIIALMHGGGFFPTALFPEVVCTGCYASVTLAPLGNADSRYHQDFDFKELGIDIPKELETKVDEWINSGGEDQKRIGVEKIVSNPAATYLAASKYPGDLSMLKICDMDLFQMVSAA